VAWTGGDLSVDRLVEVLSGGDDRAVSPGGPVTQLDHALQTAALLAAECPDDRALAVAGLVHDIGHLLEGGTDETHAADAASAVRAVLGERVAGIVALHVEAKRYLVASDPGYGGILSDDSVASLVRQGGALEPADVASFDARPHARDAVILRRADDRAKVDGLVVAPLAVWVPVLVALAEAQAGGATGGN
jgi:predicted HD phosphohydrolase